jgi:hypothetical protein
MQNATVVQRGPMTAVLSLPKQDGVQLNIRVKKQRDSEPDDDASWSPPRTPSPMDHSSSSNHLI